MASSGSLKDLCKCINAHYNNTPLSPISDELDQAIEAYVDKHQKFDESTSEKLQDELKEIYEKYIDNKSGRYVGFIAILRRLLRVIRTPDRIYFWWDTICKKSQESPLEKGLLAEGSACALDMMVLADEVEDESEDDPAPETPHNPLAQRIFSVWTERYQSSVTESDMNGESIEKNLRDTMFAWGRKKPKDFLAILDSFFVKPQSRSASAKLLCEYIQRQPPHLHMILQTPLFSNLLRSLQLDKSSTVVSLALTAVVMIIPHIPSSLTPYLPTLFNIYARLLFWDSERTGVIETSPEDPEQKSLTSPLGWEPCAQTADSDESCVPRLADYFTMLYGLYPLNFMDYVRKPQRYLRHAKVADSDDVDVQPTEIRHRSERYRTSHLLHPNFYNLTVESEKADMGRWLNSEPAELVAECMALRLPSESEAAAPLGPAPCMPARASSAIFSEASGREAATDSALLSIAGRDANIESWRNNRNDGDSRASSRLHSAMPRRASMSSHISSAQETGTQFDSPTLPPYLTVSNSQTHLQDLIHSNRTIKSGLQQSMGNESVRSLSLSTTESNAEHPASKTPTPAPAMLSPPCEGSEPVLEQQQEVASNVAQLQRHVMLLQNDLNFERYLKQQHMAHIGELRRKQVREAASEAETQHLLLENRSLKNRLEDSKRAEMQIRKESEKSRTLAKKWESDLSAKLRTLREDFKRTKTEREALDRELQSAKQESEKLRKIVCEAEVKELNSRQNMQSIEIDAAEMGRLRAEVDRLTVSERDLQAKEQERDAAVASATEAQGRAEALELKFASREKDLQKSKKLFQGQIAKLNAKLMEAQRSPRSKQAQGDDGEDAVGSALAASRAKQEALERECAELRKKHQALLLQCEELKLAGVSSTAPTRHDLPFRMDGDTSSMHSISPVTSRSRLHRVLSESDRHGSSSSLHMMQPLDERASTAFVTSSPPAAEDEPSLETRYYGRGGSGNKVKKDDKGKKKDEGEKKKSSGIRGIRGFY